jgi:hypothetical protein
VQQTYSEENAHKTDTSTLKAFVVKRPAKASWAQHLFQRMLVTVKSYLT